MEGEGEEDSVFILYTLLYPVKTVSMGRGALRREGLLIIIVPDGDALVLFNSEWVFSMLVCSLLLVLNALGCHLVKGKI